MDFTKHFSTQETPQSNPIPGKNMAQNNAGGFAFAVDDWARLDRFLILGSEGGTYYVNEKNLTIDNAGAVQRCIAENGPRVVEQVVAVSQAGRAPKNDAALFVLAMACKFGDKTTRKLAYAALDKVARIGTHLFQFCQYAHKGFGLSGRGWQTAIQRWYNDKTPADLAYQMIKYQQRGGWSHSDVLRLARPTPASPLHDALYHYAVKGEIADSALVQLDRVRGVELAKSATNVSEIVSIINQYKLTREMVPTQWLNDVSVWRALLPTMPLGALVRSLGKMTSIEMLKPLAPEVSAVCKKLQDRDYVHKSRLHPLTVLIALHIYQQGRGLRGSLQWDPVAQVVDALDSAFYLAFDNVEPTGKRIMLALDVSGSMTSPLSGSPLSCREASAAMALITARTEPNHMTTVFSCGGSNIYSAGYNNGISTIDISPRQRLDDVVSRIRGLPFGGTDCALPMIYALKHGLNVDAFVVYTDSETWAGNIHPVQALQEYRHKTGIPAKLVVVGMESNGFSIADPDDGGMLDVVGFDTTTPQIISQFIT